MKAIGFITHNASPHQSMNSSKAVNCYLHLSGDAPTQVLKTGRNLHSQRWTYTLRDEQTVVASNCCGYSATKPIPFTSYTLMGPYYYHSRARKELRIENSQTVEAIPVWSSHTLIGMRVPFSTACRIELGKIRPQGLWFADVWVQISKSCWLSVDKVNRRPEVTRFPKYEPDKVEEFLDVIRKSTWAISHGLVVWLLG